MTGKYEYSAEELANRRYALLCAIHDVEDTGRVGDDDVNVRHTLLSMALTESRALVAVYDGGEQRPSERILRRRICGF